jgi:hypothetical protein
MQVFFASPLPKNLPFNPDEYGKSSAATKMFNFLQLNLT